MYKNFDESFICKLIQENDEIYGCLSEKDKHKRVYLEAFLKSKTFKSKKLLPDDIRSNRNILLEAINLDGDNAYLFDDKFRSDREIVLEIMKKNGRGLIYADDELLLDRAFVFEAINIAPKVDFRDLPIQFHEDKEIVLLVINKGLCSVGVLSEELRDDEEVMRRAITLYPEKFEYASDRLKNNQEFVESIFGTDYNLELISDEKEMRLINKK